MTPDNKKNNSFGRKRGNSPRTEAGFTLIELLSVVALLGILATIVLVSLNTARENARDARRKSDLVQLKLALEFYYDDHQNFPAVGGPGASAETSISLTNDITKCEDGWFASDDWDSTSNLLNLVTENFISSLPKDPVNNSNYCYIYVPNANLKGACIWARLENSAGPLVGIVSGNPDPSLTTGNPKGFLCGAAPHPLDQVLLGGVDISTGIPGGGGS